MWQRCPGRPGSVWLSAPWGFSMPCRIVLSDGDESRWIEINESITRQTQTVFFFSFRADGVVFNIRKTRFGRNSLHHSRRGWRRNLPNRITSPRLMSEISEYRTERNCIYFCCWIRNYILGHPYKRHGYEAFQVYEILFKVKCSFVFL